MKTNVSECEASFVLTPELRASIDRYEAGADELPDELGCGLEAGHTGDHWAYGQSPMNGDHELNTWLRWRHGDEATVVELRPCDAESDEMLCLLPAGHVGSHAALERW